MKNKLILYILVTCLSLSHLNGFANTHSASECTSSEPGYQACVNRLLAQANNDNQNGVLVLLAIVALGGIYLISRKADKETTEEAVFRSKELANGHGIRLNSIHSPIRISLFPSMLDRFMNHKQSNYNLNESNSNKRSSNYLSVGFSF